MTPIKATKSGKLACGCGSDLVTANIAVWGDSGLSHYWLYCGSCSAMTEPVPLVPEMFEVALRMMYTQTKL